MSKRIQIFTEEQRRVRRARSIAWAKANPAKVKTINARHHARHKEKRLASASKWAAENPERRDGLNVSYRKRNRKALSERSCAWAKANPDKVALRTRARRARKKGAEGSHTNEDLIRIRAQQKDRCAYCSAKLHSRGHLDHIKPLSAGGSHWPSNLQWLCASCNLSKHAKDPLVFSRSIGLLI